MYDTMPLALTFYQLQGYVDKRLHEMVALMKKYVEEYYPADNHDENHLYIIEETMLKHPGRQQAKNGNHKRR